MRTIKIINENGDALEVPRHTFFQLLTACQLATTDKVQQVYENWKNELDDTWNGHVMDAVDPIMFDGEGRSPFQQKLDKLHESIAHYSNRSDFIDEIRAHL